MKSQFIKEVEALLKISEKYRSCTIMMHDWSDDREKMKEIREHFNTPFHISSIDSGPYMAIDIGTK